MFVVNEDLSIYVTRGDIAFFSVTAEDNGTPYQFQKNDVIRMTVYGKKDAASVFLQKDFFATSPTDKIEVSLSGKETKIGDVISKPVEYWYEITLNPDTDPQTIIGYDENGAKVFKLFPEGEEVA